MKYLIALTFLILFSCEKQEICYDCIIAVHTVSCGFETVQYVQRDSVCMTDRQRERYEEVHSVPGMEFGVNTIRYSICSCSEIQ